MIKKYKKLIIILGIIILPVIYSFFYLKAFWNPYGNIDNLKVALVNLDKCESDCQSDKFIKKLQKEKTFTFEEVSLKKAKKGLIDKDYYAIITLPENFTSSLSDNKNQAIITYSPNKKTNYLASQIIGTGVSKIENSLNTEVNEQIVKKLINSIEVFPKEIAKLGSSLTLFQEGSQRLKSGTNDLYNGLNNLTVGYEKFHDGIATLSSNGSKLLTAYKQFDGALSEVEIGLTNLNDKAKELNNLKSGINDLNVASQNFNNGFQQYNTLNMTVLGTTNEIYDKIINYANNHPALMTDEEFILILDELENNKKQINNLPNISNNLLTSSNDFNNNFNQLNTEVLQLTELISAGNNLTSSLSLLKDNSSKILNSFDKINQGILALDDNSRKVYNGLNNSKSGAKALDDGAETLDDNLSIAKDTLQEKLSKTTDDVKKMDNLGEYAKEPFKIEEKDYGTYDEYGIFFAPYFMSLSLWVGGIMIMMGLYYDPDGRFKVLGRHSQNKILRLIFYNIIAIIQALILGFLLKLCLGFSVTNHFLYYGSCILISMTFLVIIMFLFFNFKDVGRFLALVFLIIQLTACAGTFPIETVPEFFKIIYPIMPMTYSVDLLRESFVSINSDFIFKDVIVLVFLLMIFIVLIIVTGYLKQKKEKMMA